MTHRRPPVALIAAATTAALLALLGSSGPAQAKPASPQLSVAVDDGRSSAAGGDELSYTVTLTNVGTTTIEGLRLSQSVPAGAELRSSHPAGTTRAGQVGWRFDLPVGARKSVRTSMVVSATTPETLLRLATVACAHTSTSGPPLVCATDSDQLPAGARAAAQVQAAPSADPAGRSWPYAVGGAAAALLVATLAGALLWRRRRRSDELGRG